jgi:hypothetical protein
MAVPELKNKNENKKTAAVIPRTNFLNIKPSLSAG